jgi:hypothetical protein
MIDNTSSQNHQVNAFLQDNPSYLIVFANCDKSMREKDWRCRKRGTQAT